MRIYVDTNIYLDFILKREGKYVDFAAEAARLFKRAKDCEFEIILSDAVVAEYIRNFPSHEVELQSLRILLSKKLIFIRKGVADVIASRDFATHAEDALHIALAVRAGADRIITRNLQDFMVSPIPARVPEGI